MVLVIIAGLNLTVWTLRQQDSVTQAVVEKSNSSLGILNEKIGISSIRVTNANKLNVTVTNSGGAAAELSTIYIVNETASPKQQYKYSLPAYLSNLVVDGRSSVTNIGTQLPFTIKNNVEYSVKVVTKNGNTASSKLGSLANHPLALSIYIIPPTIAPGSNATILVAAQNNSTDDLVFERINATLTNSISCGVGSVTCSLQLKAVSGNNTVLTKGSTALFKWKYTVTANDKTTITFTAALQGGVSGNTVSERLRVEKLPASSADFTITEKFVVKPDIYMIIPSPMGLASAGSGSLRNAQFGIVLANPTSFYMNVSHVVVGFYNPTGSSNFNFIQSNTELIQVNPTTGWVINNPNILEWINVANPVKIPPHQTYSFFARVGPGGIGSSSIPAVSISATAYTTFGQFTKTGYAAAVNPSSSSSTAIPTLYLSKNQNNSTQTTDIIGNINNIKTKTKVLFNVTLADFDAASGDKINDDVKLVINVPKNWTVLNSDIVTQAGKYGWQNVRLTTISTDNTAQIVATRQSSSYIDGNTANHLATTFSFWAQAPDVSGERISIMTITTEGTVNNPSNFNVGAIAEIALEVIP